MPKRSKFLYEEIDLIIRARICSNANKLFILLLQKWFRVPVYSLPDSPNGNILHKHSTLIKTRKLTLKQL